MLHAILFLLTFPQASGDLASFRDGLLEDVGVLREAYETMHPGLYRYNTRAQMDRNFAQLEDGFRVAHDRREAYLRLSEFTAKVRCGHTYPNFFNQTKEVVQEIFAGKTRVPFHFIWLQKKMVVTEDLTPDHSLPRGSQIDAINGVSSGDILAKLMKVARADGGNDAKRVAILEVDGKSKWEAFDIYFPLYYPSAKSRLNLDVTLPNGRWKEFEVEPLTMEDRFADLKRQDAEVSQDGAAWSFKMLPEQVGYLKMPTWALYNSKWDWQGNLAKVFGELFAQNATGLVIDLRGNEGGNDVGDEIACYLVDKATAFDEYRSYTRYKKVSPKLQPYLDTWDRSFDDWTPWCGKPVFMVQGNNTFFPMTRFSDGAAQTIIQPKGPQFKGKVVVLVDHTNSSATFQFDFKMRSKHLATLIGQPTGGNQRGINGGAFYFLYLPHSHLEVDLPLVATFPDGARPDAGLKPDIMVQRKAADIAAGRDAELEAALKFLGSAGGNR